MSKSQTIKVIVRFRPLIKLELELGEAELNWFSLPNSSSVSIQKDLNSESFTFDRVFPTSTKQEEIFDCIGRPIVEDVLGGFNGTVFAYGQTGSGKTFTMMGSDIFDTDLRGLIPRAVSLIFETFASQSSEIECTIKCSMLEIYKENLQDLLVRGPKLKIKESPSKGIYVDGLSEIYVVCEEEVLNAIAIGEKNRSIASTKMNQQSSRSHQIFFLEVSQKLQDGSVKRGLLNLVDLAGSEKINQTGATGEKLEEAKKINLSLSALGNVIKAITGGAEHIPYRDSKLTRLLQESLGGNYKTSLIVNCSPHPRNVEDSLNTLKFAQRAKTIKNNAKANVTLSVEAYIKTIDGLKAQLAAAQKEIVKLQKVIQDHGGLIRSSTLFKDPSSPLEPISPLSPGQTTLVESSCSINITATHGLIDNFQSPPLKERLEASYLEVQELSHQLKDLESKLNIEKFKRIQAEERTQDLIQKLEIKEIETNEKSFNENRLLSENKRLESQISFLTQLLKEFSIKFTDQLTRLSIGEKLNLDDYFSSSIKNLDSLFQGPMTVKKYFPESVKLSDFLKSQEKFAIPEDLNLRSRLLSAEILTCEMSNIHWNLFSKYIVLKEKYSSLFSTFDLQKKILSSFKKLVKKMQSMYSDMFGKVYKYAVTAASNTTFKIKRPVNNVVPEVFESANPVKKDFLRRASLFHMVSNNFEPSIMLNPKQESLLVKNIENKLEVQTLLNNQLKIAAKSLKQENLQIHSALDSLSLNHGPFEQDLHLKVEKIMKDLQSFIQSCSSKTRVNLHLTSSFSIPGKIERLHTKSIQPIQIPESPITEKTFLHTVSLSSPDEDSQIKIEKLRKKDKNLTLSSFDSLSSMKSQLSKKFIKAQASPIVQKKGDLSPIFSERRSL
jgi:kinesin family protein 5